MDSLGAGFKELDTKSLREMNIRYGVQVIGLKNGKFKKRPVCEKDLLFLKSITFPDEVG